jgi:hypothetical protein
MPAQRSELSRLKEYYQGCGGAIFVLFRNLFLYDPRTGRGQPKKVGPSDAGVPRTLTAAAATARTESALTRSAPGRDAGSAAGQQLQSQRVAQQGPAALAAVATPALEDREGRSTGARSGAIVPVAGVSF